MRAPLRQLPVVLLFRADRAAVTVVRRRPHRRRTQSFLVGTWRGTMTIQPDPTVRNLEPPVSGTVTWTFEVVPQTNLQSFRTTIRSENGWLPITLTSSTSMIPGNTPPAQISTQGEYNPRADAVGHSGVSPPPRLQHSGQHHRCRLPGAVHRIGHAHEGVTRWYRSTSAPRFASSKQPSITTTR